MKGSSCDYCANFVYDEDSESYYCDINLDEDEYYRLSAATTKSVLIIVPVTSTKWSATRCKENQSDKCGKE